MTALYCGTFEHQYYYNGKRKYFITYKIKSFRISFFLTDGKCGVCGDEARVSNKLFESPGKYATGKIVKTYTQGQEIEIKHSVY